MIKFSGGDIENMKSIGVKIFRLQQNQINTLTPIQACLIFKSVQLCGVFSQLIYNQCPAPQMFPLWRSMSLQSLNPSFLKKWGFKMLLQAMTEFPQHINHYTQRVQHILYNKWWCCKHFNSFSTLVILHSLGNHLIHLLFSTTEFSLDPKLFFSISTLDLQALYSTLNYCVDAFTCLSEGEERNGHI